MKSVLQEEKTCLVCGRVDHIEEHHVFGGPNRRNSEKYGMKVYLCHWHHNEPPDGVHHNRKMDLAVKRAAQKVFESLHGHEKFMGVFGRNYL